MPKNRKGQFYGSYDTIESEILVSPEALQPEHQTKEILKITWAACAVWSVAALFYCYQFVLRVSAGVLKNDLMRDFDLDAEGFGSLSAFFYFTYPAMQIPMGMMVDRFGPRKMISLACLVCASGAFLFGSATELYVAQIGRALIGAGASCGFIGAFKVGSNWFPANRLGLVGGMGIALGTIGALLGKAPLSFLIETFGWRSAMIGISIAGIGISLLIFTFVRDRPKFAPKPIIHTAHANFFTEFGKVLKNKQVWFIALYGSCMYITICVFGDLWGEAYLSRAFNVDRHSAAAAVSMLFIGVGVGGPLFTYFSDYTQNRKLPMTIASFGTVSLLFVLFYYPNFGFWYAFPLLFAVGFMSSGKVLSFAAATENSPRELSGTVVGFTNMVCMLSGALFQPLIGRILNLNWDGNMVDGVPIYSLESYQIAMSIVPGFTFLSMFLILFVRESFHNKKK